MPTENAGTRYGLKMVEKGVFSTISQKIEKFGKNEKILGKHVFKAQILNSVQPSQKCEIKIFSV